MKRKGKLEVRKLDVKCGERQKGYGGMLGDFERDSIGVYRGSSGI